MSTLIVCPLKHLPAMVAQHGASHVLSVVSADMPVERPAGIAAANHLTLHFNDVATETRGLQAPRASDIEQMIGFARSWNRQNPMVIHCWMGVSRSTASALTVALACKPERDDVQLAAELRFLAPFASPNLRIVALADAALSRGGALVEAVMDMGRGEDCFEGTPFAMPLEDPAYLASDQA